MDLRERVWQQVAMTCSCASGLKLMKALFQISADLGKKLLIQKRNGFRITKEEIFENGMGMMIMLLTGKMMVLK